MMLLVSPNHLPGYATIPAERLLPELWRDLVFYRGHPIGHVVLLERDGVLGWAPLEANPERPRVGLEPLGSMIDAVQRLAGLS